MTLPSCGISLPTALRSTRHRSGRHCTGRLHCPGQDSCAESGRPDAGCRDAAHGRADLPSQADEAPPDTSYRDQLARPNRMRVSPYRTARRRCRGACEAGRTIFGRGSSGAAPEQDPGGSRSAHPEKNLTREPEAVPSVPDMPTRSQNLLQHRSSTAHRHWRIDGWDRGDRNRPYGCQPGIPGHCGRSTYPGGFLTRVCRSAEPAMRDRA